MEIAKNWRIKKQRYSLVGNICPHCDAKLFPPRDVCTECGIETRGSLVPQIRPRNSGFGGYTFEKARAMALDKDK